MTDNRLRKTNRQNGKRVAVVCNVTLDTSTENLSKPGTLTSPQDSPRQAFLLRSMKPAEVFVGEGDVSIEKHKERLLSFFWSDTCKEVICPQV